MTLGELIWKVGFDVDQQDIGQVNDALVGLRGTANKLLGAIGITVSIAGVTRAIKECIALSSEAEEMQNKFDVVFKGMTDTVEKWASNYADAIGRNANDIKTYLADAQNLLVGFMGQENRQAAVEMSQAMTKMALDLASFNNIDETMAVNAMQKAVMGETEAAKTLGAVLTDVTRAEAMATLGIQGKYDALDQATKMQVNYQAIVNQSKDAIDDCERSMGSYRSTLIAYQSTQKEIKTIIGQFFMPAARTILNLGRQGLIVVRDMVQGISNLADKLGGSERVLFVLAGTIAATAAAMAVLNSQTLVATIANSKLLGMLKGVGKAIFGIRASTVLIAAGFLALALIVEDFISFMQGKDSIFGRALEKAGIDCEKVREQFRAAWTGIKTIVSTVGKGIWDVFSRIFGGMVDFAAKYGPTLLAPIGKGFAAVANFLSKILGFTSENEAVAGSLEDIGRMIGVVIVSILGIGTAVKTISGVYKTITTIKSGVGMLGSAFKLLTGPVGIVIAVILALIAAGILLYKNWDTIKEKATALWEMLTTTFENIKQGVTDKVTGIRDTIVEGFESAVEYITSLPGKAIKWGADIISGIKAGIKGAIGGVGEAAAEVAGNIASFLHFSVPDEGPLSDFDTYMPDMIDLLVSGMAEGKYRLKGAASDLAGIISENTGIDVLGMARTGLNKLGSVANTAMNFLAGAGTVSTATARSVNNSSTRNIIQNVNINNQFHGDKAIQKNTAKAMDKSANDATAEMARGLAYGK